VFLGHGVLRIRSARLLGKLPIVGKSRGDAWGRGIVLHPLESADYSRLNCKTWENQPECDQRRKYYFLQERFA
jgi:hypothetical protein